MIRKPRNFLPYLRAEYARKHPDRPPKTDFNDEVLCAVAFLQRQIDPSGTRPIIEPPAFAEGAEPQPGAKPSGKRGVRHDA